MIIFLGFLLFARSSFAYQKLTFSHDTLALFSAEVFYGGSTGHFKGSSQTGLVDSELETGLDRYGMSIAASTGKRFRIGAQAAFIQDRLQVLNIQHQPQSYFGRLLLQYSSAVKDPDWVFSLRPGYGWVEMLEFEGESPTVASVRIPRLRGFILEAGASLRMLRHAWFELGLDVFRTHSLVIDEFANAVGNAEYSWNVGAGISFEITHSLVAKLQTFVFNQRFSYGVVQPTVDGREDLKTNSGAFGGYGGQAGVGLSF